MAQLLKHVLHHCHHVCRMPLILDATLNSDEALATATAKARGLERAAESSGHHDQRVRATRAVVMELCFGGRALWCEGNPRTAVPAGA